MNKLLVCNNICKSFGKKQILENISFTLNQGDILAFIGPNGSGKTTTIKLILGLQNIDKGNVFINGYDVKKDFVKALSKVGAIVENPDLYMYLTGLQNLRLFNSYYNKISETKLKKIINLVELQDKINDKVNKYSLGMRQRLGIAKALINEPNLLILDEPLNGLDPKGVNDLKNLLKKLAQKGVGILVSSHNLAELENFCNKVCLITKGKIVSINNIDKFKTEEDTYLFKVNKIPNINSQEIFNIKNNSFSFKGNKKAVANLIKLLVKNNIAVYEVKKMTLSLTDAFLNKTNGGN